MARPTEALKSLLVGRPKDTARLEHETLSKTVGSRRVRLRRALVLGVRNQEMLAVLIVARERRR